MKRHGGLKGITDFILTTNFFLKKSAILKGENNRSHMNTNRVQQDWTETFFDVPDRLIIEEKGLKFYVRNENVILPLINQEVRDSTRLLFHKVLELLPHHVTIQIGVCKIPHLSLEIHHDGINLSRYGDLISGVKVPVEMQAVNNPEGTRYLIPLSLPVFESNASIKSKLALAPYYSEIRSRITRYWGNKNEFAIALEKVLLKYYRDDNFNLHQWSRLMMLSTSQLFRKIKDLHGVSPGRYLTRFRLAKAKEKIKTTDETLSEISFDSGFKSLSHFNRAFKKQYGVNPSQMRKHLKKNLKMQS